MNRICLLGTLVLAPALIGVPGCRTATTASMGTLSARGHRPEFHIARKKDGSAKRTELAARLEPAAAPAASKANSDDAEAAEPSESTPPQMAGTAAATTAHAADSNESPINAGFALPPLDGSPVQPIATEDPFAPETDRPRLASATGSSADPADASKSEDGDPFATERAPRPIPTDDDAPVAESAPSQLPADATASPADELLPAAVATTDESSAVPPIDGALTAALDQIGTGLPLQQKSALRQLEKLGSAAKPAAAACREMLNSRDADVRAAAALALCRIEPDAVACLPGLRAGLTSADASLRELCVWSLGELGSAASDALPALTQACSHTDAHTAILAAEAIARIQPANIDAVNTLIRALNHDDRQVRQLAAYAVAGIAPQDRASVFNLGRCLRDEDARVRAAAAFALGQIGRAAASATTALEACRQDPNELVRANAELALTRIRSQAAATEETN